MDEQLRQLILKVLQCDEGSLQQQAMDRLLRLIPRLPSIYWYNSPSIDYQEAFNQALEAVSLYQDTLSTIPLRRFVEKYNFNIESTETNIISNSFVRWFNRKSWQQNSRHQNRESEFI